MLESNLRLEGRVVIWLSRCDCGVGRKYGFGPKSKSVHRVTTYDDDGVSFRENDEVDFVTQQSTTISLVEDLPWARREGWEMAMSL